MSIYTTIHLSREACLKEIFTRLADADDDELTSVLFELTRRTDNYYNNNFMIVDD